MAKSVTLAQAAEVLADLRAGTGDEAAAVRLTLSYFAQLHPGRSVEVRVPPYKAVQMIGGATHRRGTPPAVVEMHPGTWLALATGELKWEAAITEGRVQASGERSDLGALLPLFE